MSASGVFVGDPKAAHMAQCWASVREALRRDCGVRTFDHWLKPIRLGRFQPDQGVVAMLLPSPFMAKWVQQHFVERILLAWRRVCPEVQKIEIVAEAEEGARVFTPRVDATITVEAEPEVCALNPRFTFADFVTGESNALACSAARTLAEGGAVLFNPLFIHGGTGQGKTHLLHAIGHAFRAREPGATVLYMSAEKFMVEFVSAMRARETLEFKARLRSADLLMIDDIQFIGGKGSTQEEFLHTVNEIIASGRRLVIGSAYAPQALEGIEPRILSRLAMGLVADIKPADYPLRLAITKRKAASLEAAIPEPVIDLLAHRIATNIRELEGALNRVAAYGLLTGRAIDLDFTQEVLGDILTNSRRRVTIDEIQKRVCAHFDVRQSEMVSARRARVIARPRQIAMYLAKRLTPRSLPEIGRKFGGRDHTTVIYAVRQIEKLRESDADIDKDVRTLIRELEE